MKKIYGLACFMLLFGLTNEVQAQWLTSGSNIYYNLGNVGIGTSSPGQKLDVSGVIRTTSGFYSNVYDFGYIARSFNTSATGAPEQFQIKHNLASVDIDNLRGDINFLTHVDITGTLDVTGTINGENVVLNSAGNSFFQNRRSGVRKFESGFDNANDAWILRNRNDTDTAWLQYNLFVKRSTGDVGINTNAPTAKLDVNGAFRVRGTSIFDSNLTISKRNEALKIKATGAADNASANFISFYLSDNTRIGYVGDGSSGGSKMQLVADFGIQLNALGNSIEITDDTDIDGTLNVSHNNSSFSVGNIQSKHESTGTSSIADFLIVDKDNNNSRAALQVQGNGGNTEVLFASSGGNVGIGTTNPDHELTVKGKIHTEEVLVDLSVPGPDYVFEDDYDLTPLKELEAYLKVNKHLPEIPSAKKMEADGIELGVMNMLLLKKIEELTLHTIEQQKLIEKQAKALEAVQKEIKQIKGNK